MLGNQCTLLQLQPHSRAKMKWPSAQKTLAVTYARLQSSRPFCSSAHRSIFECTCMRRLQLNTSGSTPEQGTAIETFLRSFD